LLLLFLPVAALADGMVVPTVAFPAKVTVPDQRALICFSNGTERLVIETRFTGSGTNFAWVVPLPSQPVIEKATTGLFPTLQYLFRPQIIHDVPHYYVGILLAIGLVYLLWRAAQSVWNAFVIAFVLGLLFLLAALLLPALSAAKRKGMESVSSQQAVSILDRKIVGIFETTTITSRDAKALQTWLSENGYATPTNAEPVIADYVKDGWVFVATKVRRDKPDSETSTPHPLSFTFKSDKPVYPMRLTGVDNGPLMVELYVFSDVRTAAPHFKVESCTRPKIAHPLLHQWTDGSPVATKLTAKLSPSDMRNDVWLKQAPFVFEQRNRLFSRQGALTTALNWGAGLFAAGMVAACLLAFTSERYKTKLPRLVGIVVIASVAVAGVSYLCLPKIEVKLMKGHFYSYWREQQIAFRLTWGDENWQTLAQARAGFQELISNPTNAANYGLKNWDNYFVGGQFRDEDSPGNYLLRETNNQLQLVFFNPDGGEEIADTVDLHAQH
jgi:multisubunit Na+/H+ antiporter MnhB subunit